MNGKIPKVHLYRVKDKESTKSGFVFAGTPKSAMVFFANFVGNPSSSFACRLLVNNVTLLEVVWSGFLPRPANTSELRRLGFQVVSQQAGLRTTRRGGEAFDDYEAQTPRHDAFDEMED